MGTTLLFLTILLYNTASVAERCMVDSSRNLLTEIKEVEDGDSLMVRCANEMELHRQRKYLNIEETLVFCSQGKWTPELPRCINKRCSVPNIDNGQLYHGVDIALPRERIASSDTVNLECTVGYELYDVLTSRYLGLEQMEITCDRGYFAPKMPLCKPKQCKMDAGRRLLPENSTYSESGANFTVSCADKFELFSNGIYLDENTTMVSCSKGTWIPDLPRCINKRCILPMIDNSQLRKGATVFQPGEKIVSGEKAQLECNEGFELYNGTYIDSDRTDIECNEGSFIKNIPSCKEKRCQLDRSSNLLPQINYTESGSSLNVSCPENLELTDAGASEYGKHEDIGEYVNKQNIYVFCKRGTWTPKLPSCSLKACKVFALANGMLKIGWRGHMLSKDTYVHHNTQLKFSCDNQFEMYAGGYVLAGTVNCVDGSLIPGVPECRPRRCFIDPPLNLEYFIGGNKLLDGYIDNGTLMQAKCSDRMEVVRSDAYLDNGQVSVICSLGTLEPESLHCMDKRCNITQIKNGQFINRRRALLPGEMVRSSSNVGLICADGFELYNEITDLYLELQQIYVRCFQGSFTAEIPTCKPKRCLLEPPLNLEYFIGANKVLGSYIDNGTLMQARCPDRMELVLSAAYVGSDQASVICNVGTLEPGSLDCKDKRCKVTEIENGFFTNRGNVIDPGVMIRSSRNIRLVCADGYELYNEKTHMYLDLEHMDIQCYQGSFTTEIPTCKARRCLIESPVNLEYYIGAKKVLDSFIDNGTLMQARCPDRMELVRSAAYLNIEQASVQCIFGTLDPGQLDCKNKRCKITKVENGRLTNRGRVVGTGEMIRSSSNIKLICAHGYELYNKRTYMYLELQHTDVQCFQGSFTSEIPTCKPKRCKIETSMNLLTDITDVEHGTDLRIRCPNKMELHRESDYLNIEEISVFCSEGKWTPELPRCMNKRCVLPKIDNSRVGMGATVLHPEEKIASGDKALLECFEGFELHNGTYINSVWTYIECKEGSWVQNIPSCKEKRCPSKVLKKFLSDSSKAKEYYQNDETISVTCLADSAYSRYEYDYYDDIIGSDTKNNIVVLNCAEGKWIGHYPECFTNCSKPDIYAILDPEYDLYAPGDSVRVTVCKKDNAQIEGDRTLICMADGNWIGSVRCPKEQRSCNEQPQIITNAYIAAVVMDKYRHGTVLRYKCDQAFDQIGIHSVTCHDGRWIPDSANLMRCINMICHSLDDYEFENGRVTYSSPGVYKVGTVASFTCNPGYTRDGPANRTCQEDGTWSGTCVTCQSDKHNSSAMCPAPCVPDLAKKTGSHRYDLGSRVEFQCLPTKMQYSGDSSNIRHCVNGNKSAFWNGTLINCKGLRDVPLRMVAEGVADEWGNLSRALGIQSNQVIVAADEPSRKALHILQYWRDIVMRDKPKSLISDLIIVMETLQKRDVAMTLRILFGLEDIRCKHPPLNGTVKPDQSDYLFGQSVRVSSCDDGYMLVNQGYLVCSEKGTWFGNSTCRHAICSLKCGINGKCVRDNECRCSEGFSGKTCDEKIKSEDECESLPDNYTIIQTGVVQGKLSHQTVVEISCNNSQAPFDDYKRATCKKGFWDPWKPFCQTDCQNGKIYWASTPYKRGPANWIVYRAYRTDVECYDSCEKDQTCKAVYIAKYSSNKYYCKHFTVNTRSNPQSFTEAGVQIEQIYDKACIESSGRDGFV